MNPWNLVQILSGWVLVAVLVAILVLGVYLVVGASILWVRGKIRAHQDAPVSDRSRR